MHRLISFGISLAALLASPVSHSAQCSDAFRKAAANGYEVVILETTGERKSQVVLLGESHIKSKEQAEFGRTLLEHFDNFGLEGMDIGKTWGSKIFSVALDVFRAARMNLESGLTGSTIEDAHHHGEAKNKRVFNLENGHRPGLAENLGSIAIPAGVGAIVCGAAACIAISARTPQAGGMALHDWKTLASISGGLVISYGVFKYLPFEKIEKWSESLVVKAFVNGRNKTMAKNILRAVQDEQVDSLLVIVGSLHVEGIKALLVNEGFRVVPLSDSGE